MNLLQGCGTIKLMLCIISVLDRNDNRPQFEGSKPYKVVVKETERVGATVFGEIKITDRDEGRNAELQLNCVAEKSSPDACETFDVFASPSRYDNSMDCYYFRKSF